MSIPRRSYRAIAWAVGLFFLALVLRLQGLTGESPWGDEVLTAGRYPVDGLADFHRRAFTEDPTMRHAPLYHIVQYGWTRVAGDSVLALRLFSVILSLVAMLQIWSLSRSMRLGTAWAGAILLFALSPLQIYYAQEIRVYALASVFALAAIQGCYLLGRDTGSRWLMATWAANIGLILTHSVGGLLLLPQGLYLFYRRGLDRATLQWVGAHGILIVLYIGWLQELDYAIGAESHAYNDRLAGLREIAATLLQVAGGRFSSDSPAAWLPGGVNLELALVTAITILVAGLVWRVYRAGDSESRDALVLLLLWIVIPLVALFLVGRYWKPFFYTRYVLHCAFPLALLAGWAMTGVERRGWRAVLTAIVVGCAAWQSLALPRPFRADYGALARAVAADASPGKYVIALKPFNHRAAEFALRDQGVPVEKLYGFKEMVGVARNHATSGETVWAVFYRWDDTTDFPRQLRTAGLEVSPFHTAGLPPLSVYRIRAAAQASPGN